VFLSSQRRRRQQGRDLQVFARASARLVVHDGSVSIDSEESLVRSAQAGDRAAFEELVRRTSRLVLARLYLETGDAHQAEDLLQETLLTAFRSLEQLTEPTKFRAWLLRNHRLKRSPAELPLRVIPRPDENLERDETRQQVLAVLRSLPEEYRMPLTLRYLAGADYDAIQMQMGLTNGSLRGLLHRGLKLLREELQRAGVHW